jgi:hypothetical protein
VDVQVKSKVQDKTGTPMKWFNLLFAGRFLDEEKTLLDYNVNKESTLHVLTRAVPTEARVRAPAARFLVKISDERYSTSLSVLLWCSIHSNFILCGSGFHPRDHLLFCSADETIGSLQFRMMRMAQLTNSALGCEPGC